MNGTALAERWGLLICVVLAAASSLPVLEFGFVYDDTMQIVDNPNVHTWSGLITAFTDHVWSFDPARPIRYYRPLFMAVLTLGYQMFGANPLGYHALCLALHLACAALVWRLARELELPVFARVVAVLIFLLHPLQVQGTAWISAISEPMLVLAALACLLSWMHWLRSHERRALVVALVLFGAALLILERALALAGVLLLFGWYRHELAGPTQSTVSITAPTLRSRLRAGALQTLLLTIPPLAVFVLRRAAIGPGAPSADDWLRDSLLTAPRVAVRYARNFALPTDLSPAYPDHFVAEATLESVGWPVLAIAVLVLLGYLLSRKHPRRSFLLGASAVSISPALCVGLLPGHALVQDRYCYLPIVFLAMWLADLAFGDTTRAASRRVLTGRVLLMGWLLAVLSMHARALDPWRDELALFTRALEVAPDSPQFAMSYAIAAHRRGVSDPECLGLKYAAAMLQKNPRSGDGVTIQFELGNCLRENGDRLAALHAYSLARAWSGGSMLTADVNRVLLLAELGRLDEAQRAAQELTQLHAESAAAWKAHAVAAAYRGDFAGAEQAMQRSIALDPKDPSSQQLLERIRSAHGQQLQR